MSDEKQSITNCIIERRIGKFRLVPELLGDMKPDALRDFFAQLVIVRAEFMYWSRQIEYTAYSPLFVPERPELEPRQYLLCFQHGKDGCRFISADEIGEGNGNT